MRGTGAGAWEGKGVAGLADCHTHTRFSVDSSADECAMIERAIELGLRAYAVTDHCEANRWYSKEHYGNTEVYPYFDFGKAYDDSVTRITELKEIYGGRIELIAGSELGEAQECPKEAQTVADDGRVDFIIGSLHQLPGEEDFALTDFSGYSSEGIYRLLDKYFSEIFKLCKWGRFDVLGHLTYFMRYIKGKYGFDADISRYDEVIAESFRTLAYAGKGIEINTSGLRQGYGETFPSLKYIRLFKDMGGEIISLGSDAHLAEHIGAGIAEGAELAKQAGFRETAYFIKHKPIFISI